MLNAKKISLQLFLFTILILSSYFFYQKYLKNNIESEKISEEEDHLVIDKKNDDVVEKTITVDESDVGEIKNNDENFNILKNIKYTSKDQDGNIYEILAKEGIVKIGEPNKTYMNYVVAKIYLNDNSIIKINSNNAIYNRKNYNTNFSGEVKFKYLVHNISCEKMDILFDKNLAALYENLIYKNKKTRLNADRLEIDLLTKNSKIFMFDNNEKISIVSNN